MNKLHSFLCNPFPLFVPKSEFVPGVNSPFWRCFCQPQPFLPFNGKERPGACQNGTKLQTWTRTYTKLLEIHIHQSMDGRKEPGQTDWLNRLSNWPTDRATQARPNEATHLKSFSIQDTRGSVTRESCVNWIQSFNLTSPPWNPDIGVMKSFFCLFLHL